MSVISLGSVRPARPARRAADISEDGLREIVYRLVCVLWFTLPWEGVIRIPAIGTIARAVGGLVAVVAVVSVLRTGRRTRANDYIFVMLAFGAWVALSLYWSITPMPSRTRMLTMAQLVVMVLITWEFCQGRRRARGLMKSWLGGCLVVGGFIVLAWALGQSQTRYTAPGTHAGDQAYSLLIGIPMAWYLGMRALGTRRGTIYFLFVPFAILGTVLTASRAAFLTVAVALLVIPATFRMLPSRGRVAVGIGVLLSAVAALAFIAAGSAAVERLGTTSSEISSGTLDSRTTLWSIALDLLGQHPLLGVGTGGSRFAVSGAFSVDRVLHNTYLSVAVELGLVGIGLFLMLILSSIYRALRDTMWLERRIGWVLVAVFLVSLAPRTDDYNKSTYALLTLFAIMGVAFAAQPRDSTAADLSTVRR